ncbi:MAG: cell division topological specificity factor MinE [Christensenellaceae bacterium]|nr:cell division topological specificity factor MinE [Christensenellaceae bacterium]
MGLFSRKSKKTSSKIASERLKFVLTYDRARTTENTELLELLKRDILKVITEYVEIDEEQLSITLSPTRSDADTLSTEFALNIPIKRIKKLPRNR